MTPNEIRTTLLTQKQRVAEAAQGWTVVSCSPDNELTAMAALLVPNCSLASGSVSVQGSGRLIANATSAEPLTAA